jgi:hypothetical protein
MKTNTQALYHGCAIDRLHKELGVRTTLQAVKQGSGTFNFNFERFNCLNDRQIKVT